MLDNVTKTVVESKGDLFCNEQLFLEKVAQMLENEEISKVSYNMLMNLYTAKLNLALQSDISIRAYAEYRKDDELNKLKLLKNKILQNPTFYNLYANLFEAYETGKVNMEIRSILLRLMAYVDMPIDVDTYDDAEVIDYTFGKLVKDVINGNFHDYFKDQNINVKAGYSRKLR